MEILFVCLGNICRSPAAEAIMKKKLEDRWPLCADVQVDSAGIGSWHEGSCPTAVCAAMARAVVTTSAA